MTMQVYSTKEENLLVPQILDKGKMLIAH